MQIDADAVSVLVYSTYKQWYEQLNGIKTINSTSIRAQKWLNNWEFKPYIFFFSKDDHYIVFRE